jgi:D-glycero-D-manno-heptose 1,7-bisphosphate phosphatase
VSRLREAGWLVFIITNQPDVSRGHVTASLLERMVQVIRDVAPVDDVRVCAHEDFHGCSCRKPKPGMILDLARRWHVDVGRSYVVGDMWRDVGAARAAGCRAILIRRSYNAGDEADAEADSLGAAIDLILRQHAG